MTTRCCAASGRSLLCKNDLPLWSKDSPLWNKEKKSVGDLNASRPRRAPGERKSRNRSFWAPRTTSAPDQSQAHWQEVEQPQFVQAEFEPREAGTILHAHEQVFEQKAPEIVRDCQGYKSRFEVHPARRRGIVRTIVQVRFCRHHGFDRRSDRFRDRHFHCADRESDAIPYLRQSRARRFALITEKALS